MKDLRQRLLATFRVEYSEHVTRIRELLEGFEARGGASPGAELDEAFRRAHSLKGAARAVDLRDLESLAHRMESLLAGIREGRLAGGGDALSVIHQALDAGDDLMAAAAGTAPASDTGAVLAEIGRLLGEEAPAPAAPSAPVSAPVAAPTPAPPPVVAVEPEPVAPPSTPRPGRALETVAAAETVRIPVEALDQLLRVAGMLHTEVQLQGEAHRQADGIDARLRELERLWSRLRPHLDAASGAAVSLAEQLDAGLHELQQEQRAVRRAQRRTDWNLRQLNEQLQDQVRLARLVPVESVFGGFRQMAREIARDLGKEIRFQVTGLEVQADRAVLQELKDPVMHLLRNAIDHGLESPDERARRGKERAGSIILTLETTGGRLCVTVADDGRGIDVEQVRAAAVRRGLLSAQDAESLAPEQAARLILQPGFSTRRHVTDVSGRGMGLPVVTDAVQRLQGEVEILPGRPAGTVLRLTVPLSISTRSLVVVEADGQTFGLPSSAVTRLVRFPLPELRTLEGRPVGMLDEEPLPLWGLAQLLGLRDDALRPEAGSLAVAVVRIGQQRVGLVVDRFLDHVEVVVNDLGPAFADLPHLAGGFLGPTGEIILVVNPPVLVEHSEVREAGAGLRIAQDPEVEPPAILVVDDSITTRTLQRSVLEAHGYRVQVAVDGVEALSLLRAEKPDLVISDVEMPRLDGFGLLEAIRREPGLQSLPVVMVTSLEKQEHREKGLALGADAYIAKQRFDQVALLETIQRLL